MGTKQGGRLLFLTAAASGVLLNPLNSSMISLALHRIQSDFHLSFATVSWLISSFYLASVVAQPVMGKIGDHFGQKSIFLAGLALVAVSAIGAPLAPTFLLLLVMRMFQSIGSSAIYPAAMSLIRSNIREKQASALAVISVFTSATAALGPTIGGLLIGAWDWQAIFVVNFPIVVISFVLGIAVFPRDAARPKEPFARVVRELDVPGMLLFAAGMALLVWFLLSLGTEAHILSGVGGAILLAAFVVRELRAGKPFIDIRMFRTNGLLGLIMVQFVVLNIFNYSLFFGLPSYFQDELHFSVKISGLMMLFLSGSSTAVALLAGKWTDRAGFRQPLVTGTIVMLASAVLLATLFVGASVPVMACVLIAVGVSYGLGNVALQAALIQATPQGMMGTTSGLFQASRYMGSILSSVALGLVFGQEITAAHFRLLACILIAVGAGSCLLNLMLRGREAGGSARPTSS